MKHLFLNYSLDFICKYHSYSDFDKKKLIYGLEGIYLTITKLIILLLLSIVLHIFKEFVLITFLFNIIRYTGFGFHAEKSYQCLLLSIFNFILIPYLLLYITLKPAIVFSISVICISHFILFAPADTKKRPLINKKKRIIRKSLTVFIGLVYILIIILLNSKYWTSIILSVLIIEAIIVSPITYWLFGQPYNNYKALNTE